MSKKDLILFSPLGVTDPIKFNHDGPMLHIIRHYQPTIVYLFFTKEIGNIERNEHRYSKCIELLGTNCKVESIFSEIEDPSDFDAFINKYPKTLEEITNKHDYSELLLNVSSGTTQMVTALCLEAASGKYKDIKLVQVKTPKRESNIKPQSFDPDAEFQNLRDNISESHSRCHEPQILNFKKTILRSQIISLIKKYDYNGALEIFDSSLFNNDILIGILKHAKYRINLQIDKAFEYTKDLEFDLSPVLNRSLSDVQEYFDVMKVKKLRNELSDFILKITPLLTNLLKSYLEKYIPIEELVELDEKKIKNFSRSKIESYDPDLLKFLDEKCKGKDGKGFFREGFINLFSLNLIMQYIPTTNKHTQEQLQQEFHPAKRIFGLFGDIETKIRNTTAHEMVSVTEELIKEKVSINSDDILKKLEDLFSIIFKGDYDNNNFLYDRINELIINNLD